MVRKALLLAAGLGTRLRPLTDFIPKCLCPIRGAPLLDYWLERLTNAGVERILINTHHHSDLLQAYLARSPWASSITLVHEDRLLGTGGTLVANAAFFGPEPFIVAHADNLTDMDVRGFCDAHAARPKKAELTMLTFKTDAPSSCGIVETDASGLVTAFHEKVPNPPGDEANGAVYLLERTVLDFASRGAHLCADISTQLLPHYLGRMFAWHTAGYHRDVGTLASWRMAQRDSPAHLGVEGSAQRWSDFLAEERPAAQAAIRELLVP